MRGSFISIFCGVCAAVLLAASVPAATASPVHAQLAKKCKKSKKAAAAKKKKCKKSTTTPPSGTGGATSPTGPSGPTGPTGPLDTDGDGVPDSSDNCVSVANADQADADGDMKGDVCDFCPATANPGSAGCPVTIYDINLGNVPNGTNVRLVDKVVTARMADSSALWLQVNSNDTDWVGGGNAGLEVDLSGVTSLPAISVGDRVTVDGIVGTQSLAATNVAVNSNGTPVEYYGITAVNFASGAFNSSFNGQYTDITTPVTLSSRDVNGEWMTSAGFKVGKRIIGTLPACADGTSLSLFGIADLVASNLVLLPRSIDDLGLPCLTNVDVPATACVGNVTQGSVTLSAPAAGDTSVTLTSSDPTNVSVPPQVVVPNGATTSNFSFTPTAEATATITATLQGGQAQDTVSVLIAC